ncbi:MAG TPA: TonB family protein [Gemmatimonadaceae bacterium]|nr:TonB family protein [Gemmatimonadaceae bacterium]
MFDTLLESSAQHERHPGVQATAVVLHALAIAGAVVATHRVVSAAQPIEHTQPVYVAPPVEARPPEAEPVHATSATAPAITVQIAVAPVEIPDVLPPIDLSRRVTNEADYLNAVRRGAAVGVESQGTARGADLNATYLSFQVEKPALQIAGPGTPEYPEILRASGIEGETDVSFVVDTTGRADESTLRILKSTHPLFADAVKRALPRMRFMPAEVQGRNVRQLVQLPFIFSFGK